MQRTISVVTKKSGDQPAGIKMIINAGRFDEKLHKIVRKPAPAKAIAPAPAKEPDVSVIAGLKKE